MSYNVAVVGATGNVGRNILNILAERAFPINNIYPLASSKSKGTQISFGEEVLVVDALDNFDFANVDIAFFSAGSEVSAKYVPIAAKSAVVIDNTSHFRQHPDVPLVVPEVNPHALDEYKTTNIISNPNCAAIQVIMALQPLHDVARIKRTVITTFQSVSGAGKNAMDELYGQTKARFMASKKAPEVFPKPICFNLLPHIGGFDDEGHTMEEVKIVQEIQKILDPRIAVSATCVRVPVFIGHSASVNVEFEDSISAQRAIEILEDAQGVLVSANAEQYVTPIECVSEDAVYVSRVRQDTSHPNSLNMWVVSDNLRKGAALNAVQIAERLIELYI